MQIVKYKTEEESQQIIAEKTVQGFTLIEVSNITEGNFLGFLEPAETQSTSQPTNKEINDNLMVIMNGIVDIYMAQLGL